MGVGLSTNNDTANVYAISSKLKGVEEKLALAHSAIERAEEEARIERKSLLVAKDKLVTTTSELENTRGKLDELRILYDAAIPELERLREREAKDRPSIEALKEDLAQAQAKFLGTRERFKASKFRNVVLQAQISLLNKELAEAQESMINDRTAREAKIAKLRARCKDTEQQLESMRKDLEKAQANQKESISKD